MLNKISKKPEMIVARKAKNIWFIKKYWSNNIIKVINK